jgi:hypothetical protein
MPHLPKDESYPLKVHYNVQVRRLLNGPFKITQQSQSILKMCAGLSSCLPLHAGSLDVYDAPASIKQNTSL